MIKMARLFVILIGLAILLFAVPRPVFADTCTWQDNQSDDWSVVTRWSCGHLPTNLDDVVISKNRTVTLNVSPVTIASLSLSDGKIDGTGNISTTSFTWSGGTLDISGVTTVSGTLTFSATPLTLSAGTLALGSAGTSSITSSQVINGAGTFKNNGTVTVSSGKDFTVSKLNWSGGSLAGAGNIIASGTLALSGVSLTLDAASLALGSSGTGSITGPVALVTTGTIGTFKNSGALTVSGNFAAPKFDWSGGSLAGTGTTTVGETLTFSATPLALDGGTLALGSTGSTAAITGPETITGAGTFKNNGTVTVSSGDFTVSNFNWSGGSLAGAGNIIASGTLAMSGASLTLDAGSLALGSGGTGSIAGPVALITTGTIGTFKNSGTLTVSSTFDVAKFEWSGGTLDGSGVTTVSGTLALSGGSTLTLTAGTLAVASGSTNSSISGDSTTLTGTGTFSNAGTLTRSGTGTSTISTDLFTNTGTVSVSAGTLVINSDPTPSAEQTHSGTFSGAGTLDFAGGTQKITGNYTVSGTTKVSGAVLDISNAIFTPADTLGGPLTITAGTLKLGSKQLSMSTFPFSWSGGYLDGSGNTPIGSLTVGSTLALSGEIGRAHV